ncbi:hypothetical protein TNCV_2195991 [Trichonephila clavipes]|nr:hypothetical protein TNCV_2195991 [Trichonephila clavipes]
MTETLSNTQSNLKATLLLHAAPHVKTESPAEFGHAAEKSASFCGLDNRVPKHACTLKILRGLGLGHHHENL